MPISYYSTSSVNISNTTLSQALLLGQPADGGLFLPNRIPQLDFIKLSNRSSYIEVCTAVLEVFVKDDPEINSEVLRSEVVKRIDFEPQIIKIADSRYLLDLNTGPTSAFKDYGANTLAALLNTVLTKQNQNITIIVATSGDTGSAVANAFKDYSQNPNIKIVVLYPKGRVSEDQRKLMTTIGGNIHCLEVAGDFDLCQSLAKTALADTKINSQLSSSNSINWGRLLGQIPYYIWANLQLKQDDKKTIFSVPSGNLGNVTAGYIAKLMGNPTQKLIISHNQNSPMQGLILDQLLHYKSISVVTHSSAMDVTNPSNLRRLVNLYGGELTNDGVLQKTPDISAMQGDFYTQGFSDKETLAMMKKVFNGTNIIIDPHTAVGLLGVEHAIDGVKAEHPEYRDCNIVTLSTADPSKFAQVCEDVYDKAPISTEPILNARQKPEFFESIDGSYDSLVGYMSEHRLV